jgi:hypothetical protein
MDDTTALTGLMLAIDERRWTELAGFLHPDFTCHLVHTGETFDRNGWVAFNAGYPGFGRLVVEEFVGGEDAAACRSRVTGEGPDGAVQAFGCASFAQMRDGLIVRLAEVWTDVDQEPPPGTRQA